MMRRIVVLLIVVVVASVPYRYYRNVHGPVKQYEAFAEEIVHRRYDAAAAMADGLTADQLAQRGSQERIGAGPPMFQTLFPSRFVIESQERDAVGLTTLTATQTILFTPVGVESTRPAMYAVMRQVIRLRNGDGGWKVVAFENTFERMDSFGRR